MTLLRTTKLHVLAGTNNTNVTVVESGISRYRLIYKNAIGMPDWQPNDNIY